MTCAIGKSRQIIVIASVARQSTADTSINMDCFTSARFAMTLYRGIVSHHQSTIVIASEAKKSIKDIGYRIGFVSKKTTSLPIRNPDVLDLGGVA